MTLSYAYLEPNYPVPPPARLPNGGLYTGVTAQGDWGNVPVVPESHVLTTKNLVTAKPPPGAVQQSVSLMRPGNNYITHPFHTNIPNLNGMYIQ